MFTKPPIKNNKLKNEQLSFREIDDTFLDTIH